MSAGRVPVPLVVGRRMERAWHRSYDPRVPHTLEYPLECLPRIVEKTAAAFPRNTALEFLGKIIDYKTFQNQVERFAAALHLLGVEPGMRVAVMLPNCPQTVIAYHAVLRLGGVAVMTNPMYVERELEHQWGDSDAEVLVVLDHLYPKVEKVLPQTRIRKVIVTGIREYLPFLLKWLYPLKARRQKLFTDVPYDGDSVLNFSDLVKNTGTPPPPCLVQLDDLAQIQYTGGTTGSPKGVMLTHRNILSNVAQLDAWVPDFRHGEERFLAILPFFHVFGMTASMNLPLHIGAAVILVPRFEIRDFIKTLGKSRTTVFPGVPTIFDALLNHPDTRLSDLSSIRYVVTGSAPMRMETIRKFEAGTGSIIIEGFGLSEASPVTHVNPIDGVRKPGSIGLPLPDTDCRIVDMRDDTRDLPPGEPGELLIRGPQVMPGYWNNPEETGHALKDGWLHTGDIAVMDGDGYFTIIDRKKDLILAGGYNVYPREIDEVLYEHPGVREAVVVGVPDAYRGETVKAFIVPDPGAELTEEELIGFCRERLAAYKVPKSIEFRETLPKTPVGKISRMELRKDIRRMEIERNGSSVKS